MPLFKRAWVLQEQYLSRRSLNFEAEDVKWEYLTGFASSRSPKGGSVDNNKKPTLEFRTALQMPIIANQDLFVIPGMPEPDGDLRHRHMMWCDMIEDFTERKMTKMKDRLIALAGVADAIQRRSLKNTYLAGLWSLQIEFGLLWRIPFTARGNSAVEEAGLPPSSKYSPSDDFSAPSWSWASVRYPIIYHRPSHSIDKKMCQILEAKCFGSLASATAQISLKAFCRKGYILPIYQPYHRAALVKKLCPQGVKTALFESICTSIHQKTVPLGDPTTTYIFPTHLPKHKSTRCYFNNYSPGNIHTLHPSSFFLFAPTAPPRPPGLDSKPSVTRKQLRDHFVPLRGSVAVDEPISPYDPVLFVAISGGAAGNLLFKNRGNPGNEHRVHTLLLVPANCTGSSIDSFNDEKQIWKRVGYAVWEACSWYGFNCGTYTRPMGNHDSKLWKPLPSPSVYTNFHERAKGMSQKAFQSIRRDVAFKKQDATFSNDEERHVGDVKDKSLPDFEAQDFTYSFLKSGHGVHKHPPEDGYDDYSNAVEVRWREVVIV